MDPITATVVAGVVWLLLGSFGTCIIYFLVFGLGVLLAAWTDTEWLAPLFVVIAWLVGAIWQAFVLIQVVLHIIQVVQLVTGA